MDKRSNKYGNGGYTVDMIETPRAWEKVDERLQAYLVEVELYTILRQLLELNMTHRQAYELITATHMQHNAGAASSFLEQMERIAHRFIMPDTYERALVRYFWVSGCGINKIMHLTGAQQYSVYEICYNIGKDLESGVIDSVMIPFMTPPFIYSLDMTLLALSTFEGNQCRKINKKVIKYDVFKASAKRDSAGYL